MHLQPGNISVLVTTTEWSDRPATKIKHVFSLSWLVNARASSDSEKYAHGRTSDLRTRQRFEGDDRKMLRADASKPNSNG